MKKIVLFISLFTGFFTGSAQSLDRFVIASSGSYQPVGTITISYTVGELAAVETFMNPLMHLTQGFQQPEVAFKGINTVETNNGFAIFPNPAKDIVVVRYTGLSDGKLRIRLFNVLAQTIKDIEVYQEIGLSDHLIDIAGVSQGLYLIELSGKQNGQEFIAQDKLNVIN